MEIETEKKDGRLDAPKTWKAPKRTNITTSINSKVWEIAKQNNISWNQALEFGIRFLVADRDGIYWPDCNLKEKLHNVVKHRNKLLIENQNLREQVPKIDENKDDLTKVIDSVFGEVKKDE